MSEIPDNAPAPRICIITKWQDFDGYGFNLHAEKNKPGQYIGKVDVNSPAEMAGLKEGDRIIEVNGINIANENHKQVVQRIKMVPNETKLLVVDLEADQYYKSKNIVVRGDQSNVSIKTSVRQPPPPATPPPAPSKPEVEEVVPAYTNGHHEDADTRSVSSAASSSATSEGSTLPQSPMSTSPTPPPSLDNTISKQAPTPTPTPTPAPVTTTTTSTTAATKPSPQAVAKNNSYNTGGLNLNMSAAEMRAVLARKKKVDPRKDSNLDLRKKYEIIQNM